MSTKIAKDHLKSYVERIERLTEEKKAIADDIKAVFAEAKANGFDMKALRRVIKSRTWDAGELAEHETLVETYLHALGMLPDAPLHATIAAMTFDRAAREEVIEAFKQLVPDSGEIIVKMGGAPMRLWRDAKGNPRVEDITVEEADDVKPGKALKKSASVLKMVPKDPVKEAADRAEQTSAERKKRDEKAKAEKEEPETV